MADISTELARILSAIYGEDVRGSIHDAIEKINDVSEVVLTTGTAVTSPSSSSTGFYDDSLYLNTDTFELWKCTGVNTWASQGTLKGEAGDDGNGIVSIEKTSTSGLIDTYTITYTDGDTDTFTVTNGEDGANGNKWYRGTGISGKAALPTVYTTSGVADANSGDMFLNPSEGAVYSCVTGGDASTATWQYEFTITGGGGSSYSAGTGINISSSDVISVDPGTIASGENKPPKAGDVYDELVKKVNIDQGVAHAGEYMRVGADGKLAPAAGGGGGMLPYLYIDSEAGATVTVNQPDGTVITPTPAGSGHWECELTGGYGTYVIHSVLSGQGDATLSLAVDTVKEYHVTDTHYDYTINVTAPSGSTVRIVGGGETYTGTGTGTSQAFAVHTPSTQYTVTATQIMDGNTKTDEATVTSAATSGGSTNVTLSIEFGTINVSVAADFVTAGSTITCAKTGVNTISKTAASTLTFRVPETGEYTISGTVSGTPYSITATVTDINVPVSADLQSTITVNVTLHGALGAVITYTDENGSQTQTLDSDGTKANVSITAIANSSITFTDTTVAKDPDNLSNNYTKSVTITNGMTDIYVMPDGDIVYWYGYMNDSFSNVFTNNGATQTTHYIDLYAPNVAETTYWFISKSAYTGTAKSIGVQGSGSQGTPSMIKNSTSTGTTGATSIGSYTTSMALISGDINNECIGASARSNQFKDRARCYVYALWVE